MNKNKQRMIETTKNVPLRDMRGEKSDIRPIHADVTLEEFGMVRWAAQRTPNSKTGGGISLAEFFKLAVMNQIKSVVKSRIDAGRDVPPNIAFAVTENTRGLK